jgi:hypothetical protein
MAAAFEESGDHVGPGARGGGRRLVGQLADGDRCGSADELVPAGGAALLALTGHFVHGACVGFAPVVHGRLRSIGEEGGDRTG